MKNNDDSIQEIGNGDDKSLAHSETEKKIELDS